MSNIRGRAFLLGLVGWIGIVFSASAHDYRAARDFSYLNGVGVWSYGAMQAGQLLLLPEFQTALLGGTFDVFTNASGGFPNIGMENTGKTHWAAEAPTVVMANNVVIMHPAGDADAAVQFTAPESKSYRVVGFFESLDTRPNGGSVVVYVDWRAPKGRPRRLARALQQIPANANKPLPGRRFNFDVTVDMNVGEMLVFGVNSNGDISDDTTGFDVVITPSAP